MFYFLDDFFLPSQSTNKKHCLPNLEFETLLSSSPNTTPQYYSRRHWLNFWGNNLLSLLGPIKHFLKINYLNFSSSTMNYAMKSDKQFKISLFLNIKYTSGTNKMKGILSSSSVIRIGRIGRKLQSLNQGHKWILMKIRITLRFSRLQLFFPKTFSSFSTLDLTLSFFFNIKGAEWWSFISFYIYKSVLDKYQSTETNSYFT